MKIFKILSLSFLVFLVLPGSTYAAVQINEVAWMGNATSTANEWIELKNTGSEAVSLDGWRLSSNGDSPSISLSSCQISANGFLLFERTDDDSALGVSADLVYTGGLSNSGERIGLNDETGTEVDFAGSVSGDWLEGDNDTKETMHRDGTGWMTATRSPESAMGDFGCEEETETENASSSQPEESEENIESASDEDTDKSFSTHADPAPLTDYEKDIEIVVDAGRARAAATGSEIVFEGLARLEENERTLENADYTWTFGDGTTDEGRKVRHTFQFPGEYNVVLSAEHQDAHAVDRTTISVGEFNVKISNVVFGEEGFIELENHSAQEVNLGGSTLKDGEAVFMFPKDTIINANARVRFSNKITGVGLNEGEELTLKHGEYSDAFEPERDAGEVRGASIFSNVSRDVEMKDVEQKLANAKTELSNVLAKVSDKSRERTTSRGTSVIKTKNTSHVPVSFQKTQEKSATRQSTTSSSSIYSQNTQSSSSENVIVVQKPESWWQKVLNWFAF